MNIDVFKNALAEDRFKQKGSVTPLYLLGAGMSGFNIKPILGYGYTDFLYIYKESYGEMHYLIRDFNDMWQIIKAKLAHNPHYLAQVRRDYQDRLVEHEDLYHMIDKTDLSALNDTELLKVLRQTNTLYINNACGTAHICEAVSHNAEAELIAHLPKSLTDNDNFAELFATLTAPTEQSFLSREEDELARIATLNESELASALEKHQKRYHWVNNSYAGDKYLSIDDFRGRLGHAEALSLRKDMNAEKNALFLRYQLNESARMTIHLIDFTASWQDERKGNILKTIHYLDRLLLELARRTKIDIRYLRYLFPSELEKARVLADIEGKHSQIRVRYEGVAIYTDEKRLITATREDYSHIVNLIKGLAPDADGVVRGLVARKGMISGRVAIVHDVTELDKVKNGDIIVASMTRPEYMPALRKAAAIVTDEGGITCHAAIVARELGVPCIIGTKHATTALKDDDFVVVDANKGVVSILY